jgi:hypothetical protein
LLTAFAGSPAIVTREMIAEYMEEAIITKTKCKQAIELLCDTTFLDVEASSENFEFIYDEMQKNILLARARKVAKMIGVTRYKINVVYHSYLGITQAGL